MTSITLGLDDELAARLMERAARAGISSEELAHQMLAEGLAEISEEPIADHDPSFDFIGIGASEVLRGSQVDELLAEGFGQFRS